MSSNAHFEKNLRKPVLSLFQRRRYSPCTHPSHRPLSSPTRPLGARETLDLGGPLPPPVTAGSSGHHGARLGIIPYLQGHWAGFMWGCAAGSHCFAERGHRSPWRLHWAPTPAFLPSRLCPSPSRTTLGPPLATSTRSVIWSLEVLGWQFPMLPGWLLFADVGCGVTVAGSSCSWGSPHWACSRLHLRQCCSGSLLSLVVHPHRRPGRMWSPRSFLSRRPLFSSMKIVTFLSFSIVVV